RRPFSTRARRRCVECEARPPAAEHFMPIAVRCSAELCGAETMRLRKKSRSVGRELATSHALRPQLKRRLGNEAGRQGDHPQIIAQVFPAATAGAPAPDTRMALAIRARASEVLAISGCQEDVRAEVEVLALALQLPAESRQSGDVCISLYGNEHVGVFRVWLGRGQ